jgi:hypothetical protein
MLVIALQTPLNQIDFFPLRIVSQNLRVIEYWI